MASIINGISLVLAKFAAALKWIGELFIKVFVALWDILKDLFSWGFEQGMDVSISAMSAIDVSGVQDVSGYWTGLPGEILNVLGLIGFGQAMALIVVALGIRLVLQLIPFTRLGS